MELPNYQLVVDLYVSISLITFPLALIICIVKVINKELLSFIFGKEVDFKWEVF